MPITRQQALDIARRKLADVAGDEMVIREDVIVEREFGWAFYCSSREYIETGDLNKAVPGYGPLVVERNTGSTEFLSTSGPPERGIEHFEQQWRERQKSR